MSRETGGHTPEEQKAEKRADFEARGKAKETQMFSKEDLIGFSEDDIMEEAKKLGIVAKDKEQLKAQVAEMRAQTREELRNLDVTIDQEAYLKEFEKLSALDKIDSLISMQERLGGKK